MTPDRDHDPHLTLARGLALSALLHCHDRIRACPTALRTWLVVLLAEALDDWADATPEQLADSAHLEHLLRASIDASARISAPPFCRNKPGRWVQWKGDE